MDYIKKYYDLPFLEIGVRVEVNGETGTVTSTKNAYVMVKFDGDKRSSPCHLTWGMKYFDGQRLIKDFT